MGQHLTTVDQQPMIELGLLTSASHLSLQAMTRMNGAFHHAIGWEVDDVGGQGRPGVQDHGEPVVPNPKPIKPADPLAVQAIPDAGLFPGLQAPAGQSTPVPAGRSATWHRW